MSLFDFLGGEWPAVHEAASKAAAAVTHDPRTACFYARYSAAIEKLKTAQRASLTELDAFFAALQHRPSAANFERHPLP